MVRAAASSARGWDQLDALSAPFHSVVMSDSGSSTTGEARMLERRVSNNRADLSGDQQMNYFLSWFTSWSELQRSDFVSVLAGKMSVSGANGSASSKANGTVDGCLEAAFKSMDMASSRPPTLFSCQVKLFHDWFSGWSDDQKNYLVLRLKDIDAGFYSKYEDRASDPSGGAAKEKDYFEPGIPAELVNTPTVVQEEGKENDADNAKREKNEDDEDEDEDLKKKVSTASAPLSPISEDN